MERFKALVTPHSHPFSLDTASIITDFADRELELNTGYMTCTDHGTLGACREVYKIAHEKGLIPILGVEGYLRDDNDPILKKFGITDIVGYNKYYHITMHALDQEAYEALVKTISKADLRAERHGSERKPLFTWEDLEYLGSKNITMMSSCLVGLVARHLTKNNRPDIAEAFYTKLRSIVKPGNFYVELFPHCCDRYWEDGIYLVLENDVKERYWTGKKFEIEGIGEVKAEELTKLFKKNTSIGKLLSIKNGNKWDPLSTPLKIINCERVQGFTLNECMVWAPDSDYQLGTNKFILSLATKYGDPIMVSDDSHYARKEDKPVQDARLGSGGQAWKMYEHYHRMSSDEAWEYFNKKMNIPQKQFEEWLDNSRNWASRFKDFKFIDKKYLPASFYPQDTLGHLGKLIDNHGRMNWSDQTMVDRLKIEINLLHYNGTIDLLPYFFCLEEGLQRYSDKKIIVGSGRGSAAGLLISYLLEIVHVDPIAWDLSLDRFLTLDRIASGRLPDIDTDLPDRTDPNGCEILKWLNERFSGHFAQISTNSLLHLKSSMKDVARSVLGFVPEDIEKISESLPVPPQGVDDRKFIFGYTSDDGNVVKGLLERNFNLQNYVKRYPDQWEVVQKSLKLCRQKGVHASAFVISDRPVDEFLPLQTITDVRATQYTAESVEEAGGVKIDFLGLNTLKDINLAVKLIQERHGSPSEESLTINGKSVKVFRTIPFEGKFYDIYDLPERQEVFNEICEGRTESVFQVSTDGAKKWLKEFNYFIDDNKKCINSLEDLSAFIALDRKGPLDAYVQEDRLKRNMLQEYAARVRGIKIIDSLPILNEMFPKTKGILIYQESVQKLYQHITGCSGAEANTFRENIAKKKTDKVNKSYNFYMERAIPKLGEEIAKKLWDMMNVWSGYGFNAAHAASYAVETYACAFLKYYYPIEWWTAVLNNADKNEIAQKFWKHCKHLVIPPDINKSKDKFYILGDKIVAPLNLIQGVGQAAHKELIEGLPYINITDFCQKIIDRKKLRAYTLPNGKIRAGASALNNGVISKLILSGVLDTLFPPNMDTISKLELYNSTFANLESTKIKKLAPIYQEWGKLKEYQLKKTVFPIYSDYLAPYIKIPDLIKQNNNNETDYYLSVGEKLENELLKNAGRKQLWWSGKLPIVNGSILDFLNQNGATDGEKITIGTIAYVMESRTFSYNNKNGTARAQALILDVDNEIFDVVKWGDWKTGKLTVPSQNPDCAIILAVLTKAAQDKPFQIDSYVVLKEAIQNKEE